MSQTIVSPPARVEVGPPTAPSVEKEEHVFRKVWRDPVWSKVIANSIWWAGGGLLALGAILALWLRHHFGH
jgi:hypothetical protein